MWGGSILEVTLASNMNMEPGILRAIVLMGPTIVAGLGLGMAVFYRSEKVKYLRGFRDGMLQEVQRTATLAD